MLHTFQAMGHLLRRSLSGHLFLGGSNSVHNDLTMCLGLDASREDNDVLCMIATIV